MNFVTKQRICPSNIYMNRISDKEIIKSVLNGKTADYALLVEKYKDRGFNLLMRMLHNRLDAEEVLQDSFLKAFNSLDKFRWESEFSTWFYKIVFNSGLSFLSSKRKKNELLLQTINENQLKNIDSSFFSKSESVIEFLNELINKLPIRNSLILILYYIDGLKLEEISEILDISLSNAKVLLYRSRNLLKELIIEKNFLEELL